MNNILKIKNMRVDIKKQKKQFPALLDINLEINEGEIVGIIGESGCGKSLTSYSVMGLLPRVAKVTNGEIYLCGERIDNLKDKELCKIRGKDVAMIFQEPMTSLNPLMKIGAQIAESYLLHNKGAKDAKEKVLDIMRKVGLSRVEKLYNDYPHQLSGGMKQRVVIALALINSPKLLIADEPTTALDVTIQNQILELLKKLNRELGISIMFISHDIGVIKEISDKMIVMYAGKIVETGKTSEILKKPNHPYTKGLLSAMPKKSMKDTQLYTIPGIVEALEKRTHRGCGFVKRCPYAVSECESTDIALKAVGEFEVACNRIEEINND